MEACYFTREKDGQCLAVMENCEENWDRVLKLAREHVFETATDDCSLVIRQGLPSKSDVATEVYDAFGVNRRGVRIVASNDLASVCRKCPEQSECWQENDGIVGLVPCVWGDSSRRTTDIMRSQFLHQRREKCQLISTDDFGWTNDYTLRRSHLEAVGLKLFSKSSFFSGASNVTVQGYREAVKLGLGPEDIDDLRNRVSHVWVSNVLGNGWKSSRTEVALMDFGLDGVEALAFEAKMRGSRNKKKIDKDKEFKSRECDRCVYACPGLPWNKDSHCALELGEVVRTSDFSLTKRQLLWLAAFTISGSSGKFRNPNTGRRKNGIGYAPHREADGSVSMIIKSLVPSYGEIDHIDLGEYWREVYEEDYPGDDKLINRLGADDPERLAVSHWVLERLVDMTRHSRRRFYGGYAYSKLNDVLSIEINSGLNCILIGSDTKATNSGGFMSRGGSGIHASERPRFRTSYDYPYFRSVFDWFGEAPGARGGFLK